MSNSNRGVVIAAICGLALLSAGVGSYATALHFTEKQQERAIATYGNASERNGQPQQYLSPRSGIPATIEGAISNPQPTTGQNHEKRDLAAQEASATFAWWMVVVSGLGFAVTTLGTFLLYQQIRLTWKAVQDTNLATIAMGDANTIARENMKRQLRAYIAVDDVESVPKDANGSLQYRIGIKNYGQTPASNLCYAFIVAQDEGELSKPLHSYKYGNQVIAPSQTWGLPVAKISNAFQQDATLTMIIEIRYTDAFGAEWSLHQRFIAVGDKWHTDHTGNYEECRKPSPHF